MKVLLTIATFILVSRAENDDSPPDYKQLVLAGNGEFAQDIYRVISRNDDNVVFSPLSIHASLSILHQGASGEVYDDLSRVLRLSSSECAQGYKDIMSEIKEISSGANYRSPGLFGGDNITIGIANKIYLDEDLKLKESFRDLVVEKFLSEVEGIKFSLNAEAAAEQINNWVKDQTQGKIKDLLKANDLVSALMVLVNAIYFKGAWEYPFDANKTRLDKFDLNSAEVDMMELDDEGQLNYKDDQELDAQVLELPYHSNDGSQFSMIVVLPHDIDGIQRVEEKVLESNLSLIMQGAHNGNRINVKLPRFKIVETLDLQSTFEQIGLGKLFEDNKDLQGLIDGESSLKVSKAVHKAFIEVNEQGSEAAAATGIVFAKAGASIEQQKVDFHANHPFIFLLTHRPRGHEHKNIIFFGRFINPLCE